MCKHLTYLKFLLEFGLGRGFRELMLRELPVNDLVVRIDPGNDDACAACAFKVKVCGIVRVERPTGGTYSREQNGRVTCSNAACERACQCAGRCSKVGDAVRAVLVVCQCRGRFYF